MCAYVHTCVCVLVPECVCVHMCVQMYNGYIEYFSGEAHSHVDIGPQVNTHLYTVWTVFSSQ